MDYMYVGIPWIGRPSKRDAWDGEEKRVLRDVVVPSTHKFGEGHTRCNELHSVRLRTQLLYSFEASLKRQRESQCTNVHLVIAHPVHPTSIAPCRR